MSDVMEDILVWAVLLALVGLTLGISYLPLGVWTTIISFAISGIKTVLVAWFYMHLRREKGMTRIFALAGLAWLGILFCLTLNDYLTRGWLPYPSRWPVMVKLRPALRDTPVEPGEAQGKAPQPGQW